MKKILTALLMTISITSFAHGYHGYGHRGYYGGYGWVAPVIIGGAIGYELARPNVIVQQPAPVIIQQPPSSPLNCTPYQQAQLPDGQIVWQRTCY
jgi:hypothetical protein